MGVSFDCFGTLVTVERRDDPASAVATELEASDVSVPADWADRYATLHVDAPAGAEVPLPDHVGAALRSAGVDADGEVVRRAVVAAFDPDVSTREGAVEAVAAARDRGPVAICSNCSVPGLVSTAVERSALDPGAFDAVVTSVDCGWRKPTPRIFELTADRLGVEPSALVHVGDDREADGGVEAVGGTAVVLADTPLAELPARLAEVVA